MLSLQRYFDTEKFALLFDAYNSEEAEINQRALVGLLVNLYRYDLRLPFYPEINGRLKILNENPEFKRNLERVIVQFIRSKETEKLQQRIRDEIMPEMIKISPNLKDKINLDSLMDEGFSEDKNPDWEEIFKDSPGLMDKMQEFSELQMEGADVFMGSFAMLKSFPFYGEMGNWFIPFFPENPEIADILNFNDETSKRLMEALDKAPVLCNSDKYSFCFSIQSLPKENREFMIQGIHAEMDQLKELEEDEELTQPGRKAEFISNQYIQDLYRFYKLFPRKTDFEDIFNWRFDFHNKIALGDILREDVKVLRNIAEYYFAKNHFEEATEVFGYLLEQEKNGELYQKIAYCYQKLGDFEKALDGYLKAELYDINRLWNLKKIALCYRNLKHPDKALEYYKAAEKIDSESLNTQLNIGHCLLELSEYDEALKCYFKVEYLAPGNKKVWRPIAWCSFLTGKKEQAEKYFQQLVEDEPGKHDYMNMGHVQWSLGNRKSALDYYKKSISKDGFSEAEFLNVFEEDLPHLLSQGIESEDVPIMLDQLRYSLEE
jgi:tetratricopeptide (TPR) repeat protein